MHALAVWLAGYVLPLCVLLLLLASALAWLLYRRWAPTQPRPVGALRDRSRAALTWILGVIGRHRPIVLALFSTIASAFVSLSLQTGEHQTAYRIASLVLVFLVLFTGLTPSRFAAANLMSFMLPAIHHALSLAPDERITVHLLISGRREKYEQLTDYYPNATGARTRGRVFTFSHGIVGQVFKTHQPLCWSVLEVVTKAELAANASDSWKRAMTTRWGFDAAEMALLTPNRRSFLAHPIGQEGHHARAVLFVDSPNEDRFQQGRCNAEQDLIRTIFVPQLSEALRGV